MIYLKLVFFFFFFFIKLRCFIFFLLLHGFFSVKRSEEHGLIRVDTLYRGFVFCVRFSVSSIILSFFLSCRDVFLVVGFRGRGR